MTLKYQPLTRAEIVNGTGFARGATFVQLSAPIAQAHGEIVTCWGDFLHARVGTNWVIARRTPHVVAKYGPDVVCLSAARYRQLRVEYEKTRPPDEQAAVALLKSRGYIVGEAP